MGVSRVVAASASVSASVSAARGRNRTGARAVMSRVFKGGLEVVQADGAEHERVPVPQHGFAYALVVLDRSGDRAGKEASWAWLHRGSRT